MNPRVSPPARNRHMITEYRSYPRCRAVGAVPTRSRTPSAAQRERPRLFLDFAATRAGLSRRSTREHLVSRATLVYQTGREATAAADVNRRFYIDSPKPSSFS